MPCEKIFGDMPNGSVPQAQERIKNISHGDAFVKAELQNAFLPSNSGQKPTRTEKVCVSGAPTASMTESYEHAPDTSHY